MRAWIGKPWVAVAMLLFWVTGVQAQTYPTKPVNLVVPFPAGGGIDVVARILQPRLSEYLGQPVVVDNRAGANGVVGSSVVARAPADGYTLMLTYEVLAINPHLYKGAAATDEFEYVNLLVSAPQVLVSSQNFKAGSVPELLAAARVKADGVSFGSPGSGSTSHLGMLMLAHQANARLLHVPYKGGAPLMQGILAGEVDVAFTLPSNALASIKSGKLKALGVAGKERLPQLPDVPPLSETLPDFLLSTWYVLAAPRGTPPEVVARLNREIQRVIGLADVRQRLEAAGFQVQGRGPAETDSFVKSESEKLGKVIRDFSVKVD